MIREDVEVGIAIDPQVVPTPPDCKARISTTLPRNHIGTESSTYYLMIRRLELIGFGWPSASYCVLGESTTSQTDMNKLRS